MLNINTYYIVYTILHYIHICVIKLHICYDRYTEHDLMRRRIITRIIPPDLDA